MSEGVARFGKMNGERINHVVGGEISETRPAPPVRPEPERRVERKDVLSPFVPRLFRGLL